MVFLPPSGGRLRLRPPESAHCTSAVTTRYNGDIIRLMAGTSSLEGHPQRDRIISAIVAKRPYREIAAWTSPPVTPMALSRYKSRALAVTDAAVIAAKKAIAINSKGLPSHVMDSVTQAALTVAVDPFASRALRQDARRSGWMDDLEQAPEAADYRTLAALDRNDLQAQEFSARLAGRLDADTHQVNVSVLLRVPR